MKILILAAAALVLQLVLFLCIGSIVMRVRKKKIYAMWQALLLGYFVYFGIFEVICLVFEVSLLPLHTLSAVIGILSAAAIAAGIVLGHSAWKKSLNSIPSRLKMHGWQINLLLLVLFVSMCFAVLYSDASADSGWYVGMASTALATDTIGRFDPSTGVRILRFQARYALDCYPYHTAVVCSIFRGLPAIVEARTVMSLINMLMSFLASYGLGRALFADAGRKKDAEDSAGHFEGNTNSVRTGSRYQNAGRKSSRIVAMQNRGMACRKRADLFVLFVFILNIFSSTIYMPGIFLFTRTYEGKALIVNVVIIAVLAICVSLWREMRDRKDVKLSGGEGNGASQAGGKSNAERLWYRSLFWIMAAGVCFSASSMMAMILAWAAILPLLVIRRRWKMLPALVFGTMPVIVWALVYYAIQHGWFVLRAWR